LCGEGWGRIVRPSGGLGGPGPVGGKNVDGGGGCGANTVRTKAGEKRGDVARIRERESASRAVVVQSKAKKFGRDGVGFAMIKRGKTRDEILKVIEMVVFGTEVIYHQDKSDRTRDVAEKARSSGFEETVGSKVGDESVLGELARLLQFVHRFVDAEKEVGLAQGVSLNEGLEEKAREDGAGEKMGVDFYELRVRKRSAKIEIGQVN
jgi:hypothetical protein